jgi:hypothetical protein
MNDSDPELYALDPDDARVREVFARFGRAFYESNCLERQIAGALLHVEWRASAKPSMSREQFHALHDRFYSSLEFMSMGRLIARIKKLPDLPADTCGRLDECLEARNKLAHHYFWERSGEFALREGQLQMMEECDAFCSLFERTDAMLVQYMQPYLMQHGITEEALEVERRRLVEDAAASLGASTERHT